MNIYVFNMYEYVLEQFVQESKVFNIILYNYNYTIIHTIQYKMWKETKFFLFFLSSFKQ